ncbi:MAG: aromatic ring-hydroxylating dioxygenase subunit alpha [Ilumatobacteraceae bacterium]
MPELLDAPAAVALPTEVLRATWHAVARSCDVGERPLAVELLDTALVVARLDGGVRVFDDVCVHRGAALSLGRVTDGCLECPYHGWQYDHDGACAVIPALPRGRHIPSAARLTARRSVERGGLVWVCLDEPIDEVPRFPEPAPGWAIIVGEPYEWACDPTRRLENFLDFAHFAFIHDGLLGDRSQPEVPDHTVDTEGSRLLIHQVRDEPTGGGVKPAGDDTAETFRTIVDYVVHVPLAGVLHQTMPNGERFVLAIASTPVAGGRSRTFWVLARDYDIDEPDEPFIDFQTRINDQDRPIIESLRPDFVPVDLTDEIHLRGVDAVAVAYRRALRALVDEFERSRPSHPPIE